MREPLPVSAYEGARVKDADAAFSSCMVIVPFCFCDKGFLMTNRFVFVFLTANIVAVAAVADPMRYPYWQMIKDVNHNIEARPPRPCSVNDSNAKSNIEYPFEMFRHLRASDVFRAAREGAQEARLQAALGKSKEEIEALVFRNVAIALEYLPMLIRSEKDIEELSLLLGNREEDDALRRYLLQNTFPGYAPQSFLSLSLPELIDDNADIYSKWTWYMATHPAEEPRLQCMALEICYARLRRDYQRITETNPAVREQLESGASFSITDFRESSNIVFSRETNAVVRELRGRFHDFANAIAGHIAKDSTRAEEVKEVTKGILEDMRDNIKGLNKSVIEDCLEGKFMLKTPIMRPPAAQTPELFFDATDPKRLDDLMQEMIKATP